MDNRTVGFHASHELASPGRLLVLLQRAEQAGFRAGMCSDHFHPWTRRENLCGFAWPWLGAALESTGFSLGVVCAPGQRYHPAIIAQAAATLTDMYPGRFWMALGSGEAVNESITGTAWPPKAERNARLRECVDVMRQLWDGKVVTHHGLVNVFEASLSPRPLIAPLIFGAAMTVETARWIGQWGDGLITAESDRDQLRKKIDAFREGGGEGKPVILQSAVSYASTADEAVEAARRNWPHAALNLGQIADLPNPEAFERATALADLQTVGERLRCSPHVEQHIEWLNEDFELGVSAIHLHHVGPDIERFIDVFGDAVLPRVCGRE